MLNTNIESGAFKNWMTALNSLLNEANFQITKDGIQIRAMDPSQVALVNLHIEPEHFNSYDFKSENEKETYVIDIGELTRIIKRAKPDDVILFNLKKKIELTLEGKTIRRYTFGYLTDHESPSQKLPDIEFTAKAKPDAKILKELLKDAKVVGSSHCKLSIGSQMSLASEGDFGSLDVESIAKESEAKEQAESIFNIDFLEKMLSAAKGLVTIELKSKAPLKLSYELKKGTWVTYFLAPRIDSE